MAQKTPNLNLIKPGLGEFYNKWDKVVNSNMDIIDSAIGDINNEIQQARGSQATLADRLNTGTNPDGSLKPSTEVLNARSSKVYGSNEGGVDFQLDDRLEKADKEIFGGRQGLPTLVDGIAWAADQNKHNSVISATSNYLTYAGAVVTINGSVTPMIANINGYRQVVDIDKQVTIAGAAGNYYLYIEKVANGQLVVAGVASSGTTSTFPPTGKLSKFVASSTNFVTSKVKPGHILNITAPVGNLNVGSYIIAATNVENPVDLAPNEVLIIGEFTSATTGLTFDVYDSMQPAMGFTATPHAKVFTRDANRIYIGRCYFDGAQVTSLNIYALQGKYSSWQAVALSGGNFSLSYQHNLGFFPSKVSIFASQAGDFSQPLELISVAEISGTSTLQRSVISRMNDLTIEVKNATNGLFYKDYSGIAQTAGFLYVVVER